MERWQLEQMQSLPLAAKIEKTKLRIKEWYERFDGEVYVSFSGGKDSIVLLDIARQLYPDIEAAFVDTQLEYPELKEIVRDTKNVTWLKPKMHFKEVVEKYGYPAISKEQAQYISQYKTAKSEKTKDTRWNGNKWGLGKISEKWKFVVDAPFNVSDRCCDVMKKNPVKKYEKETGKYPIIGNMASESNGRRVNYLKYGCNSFDAKRPTSKPLGFWLDNDIIEYLYISKLKYPSVYGEIVKEDDEYKLTGVNRTGCMFCMFGLHMQGENNKFQKMKKTHPKLHDYCVNKLGCGEVLDFIGVPYE